VPAHCIFQVEIEFKAKRAACLGVRLLPELDRIEGIAEAESFFTFSSHSCYYSLCINGCSDEKTTWLQTARGIVKKGT
jgi:hypothetical protein